MLALPVAILLIAAAPPFPSEGRGRSVRPWVTAAATAACLARQPTRPARPGLPATGRTTASERSLTALASVAAVRASAVVWHAVGISGGIQNPSGRKPAPLSPGERVAPVIVKHC